MKTLVISLDTSRSHFVDITVQARRFCSEAGRDGLLNVFSPHATAGLALMETGAGSEADLEQVLEELLPRTDRYGHGHGSTGHGADHLLPAFLAPSLSIPVVAGEPALGTWQSVVLVDFNRDNPQRKVRFSFLSD
jgi:secondary thiamine-phosphate synthase enzyme